MEQEILEALQSIQAQLKDRQTDFATIEISDFRDWKLDYRGYRYCYFWLPSAAYTLSFDEYGQGTVQPQVWTNLNMRPGTVIKTVGQTNPVAIQVAWSDWLFL